MVLLEWVRIYAEVFGGMEGVKKNFREYIPGLRASSIWFGITLFEVKFLDSETDSFDRYDLEFLFSLFLKNASKLKSNANYLPFKQTVGQI